MTHQINSTTIGLELKEGAYNIEIHNQSVGYNYKFPKKRHHFSVINLPPGDWTILCLASECSEEEAKEVVEVVYYSNEFLFKNYLKLNGYFLDTALESLHSYCRSIGVSPDRLLILTKK